MRGALGTLEDEIPQVITGLDDEAQVTALELARAVCPDLLWRIELDEPLPARPDRLGPEARRRAVELAEDADRGPGGRSLNRGRSKFGAGRP